MTQRLVSLETNTTTTYSRRIRRPKHQSTFTTPIRLRWFKELFSPTNNAEWKVMALHEFDVISKTQEWARKSSFTRTYSLKSKDQISERKTCQSSTNCGGQYTPPNEDSQRPTASYINSFPPKLLDQDTKTFATKGITQLSQFVDTSNPMAPSSL